MVNKISDIIKLDPAQLEKAMDKSPDPQFEKKASGLKEKFSLKRLVARIFGRNKNDKQEESFLPTMEEISAARNYSPTDLSTVKVTLTPQDDDLISALIVEGNLKCTDQTNFFQAIGNTFEQSRVVEFAKRVSQQWQGRLSLPELVNRIAYFWIVHKNGIKKIVEENEMTEVPDDTELLPEILSESTTIFFSQNGSIYLLMPHADGIEIHYNRVPFHDSFAGKKPNKNEQEVVYTVKPQEIFPLKEGQAANLKKYYQMVPVVIYTILYPSSQQGEKILKAIRNHNIVTMDEASAALPPKLEDKVLGKTKG